MSDIQTDVARLAVLAQQQTGSPRPRRSAHSLPWFLGYGLPLIPVLVVIAGWVVLHGADTTHRAAAIAQCERVQILRHEVNVTTAIAYETLRIASARSSRASARRGYKRMLALLTYTPATDCHAATDQPEQYQPPAPITFRARPDVARQLTARRANSVGLSGP